MGTQGVDKKSMILVVGGYLIWGVQPLYWGMMGHMDSLFVMACRILWAVVFTVAVMAYTKRLPELKALFRDKKRMRYLAPASLFLLIDWAVFIVAVQAGHVLDTSLGYYMNPLAIFLLSIVLFKEKCGKMELMAIALAVAGVVVSAVQYGKVPVISLILAVDFAIYGALKKYAKVEPLLSIAAETIMMAPLAIVFILFFRMGDNGIAAVSFTDQLLLIGSGVVTAMPMILYSRGVNSLPFLLMGFIQYLSPTLSLLCGLLMGEQLSPDKLVSFLFIWAGLILFSISIVLAERKRRRELPELNQ